MMLTNLQVMLFRTMKTDGKDDTNECVKAQKSENTVFTVKTIFVVSEINSLAIEWLPAHTSLVMTCAGNGSAGNGSYSASSKFQIAI